MGVRIPVYPTSNVQLLSEPPRLSSTHPVELGCWLSKTTVLAYNPQTRPRRRRSTQRVTKPPCHYPRKPAFQAPPPGPITPCRTELPPQRRKRVIKEMTVAFGGHAIYMVILSSSEQRCCSSDSLTYFSNASIAIPDIMQSRSVSL
jgi:hypothetical protein